MPKQIFVMEAMYDLVSDENFNSISSILSYYEQVNSQHVQEGMTCKGKRCKKKKENAAKGTKKITYLFKAQVSNETM